MTLGVDTFNKDARRLYERLGYNVLDEDGWGKGKSRYEAMVLDLVAGPDPTDDAALVRLAQDLTALEEKAHRP